MSNESNTIPYKKPKEEHPIVGEPPSVPEVEKPVVHPEVKGQTVPSHPETGTRSPEHKWIPWDGTHQEQRGHDYPEDPRVNQKPVEQKEAARKAITAQVKTSTPTAEMVKESQQSKAGN